MRQQQYIISLKLWLILGFCGGTYTKFGEQSKGGKLEVEY